MSIFSNASIRPFPEKPFLVSKCQMSRRQKVRCIRVSPGEGGGRCLQGNLWYSPPASMTSRLASVTFKMASKVVIEETDKNFDFIREILFRFLGFGDFKVSIVSIVIENIRSNKRYIAIFVIFLAFPRLRSSK